MSCEVNEAPATRGIHTRWERTGTAIVDDAERIVNGEGIRRFESGTDRDVGEDDGGGRSVAVGLRVNDFETVQEALGELSTYGEHVGEHPLSMPSVAALDRIEAEVERLKNDRDEYLEVLTKRMLAAEAEVERLRAENERYRTAYGRFALAEEKE
jgi:hypothetical protein